MIINNVAINTAMINTRILICFDSFSTRIVSGDFSSSVWFMLSAILPSSVFNPIPTITPLARPLTTVVPENAIFFWSEIVSSSSGNASVIL